LRDVHFKVFTGNKELMKLKKEGNDIMADEKEPKITKKCTDCVHVGFLWNI
jgi:hypothetical protein